MIELVKLKKIVLSFRNFKHCKKYETIIKNV